MAFFRLMAAGVLICFAGKAQLSRSSLQAPSAQNSMPDPGFANLPEQPIGAFDLLSVSVYGAPELTRTVRVSQDGFVTLPMMAKPFKAAGLMPSDLESAIGAQLKAEALLVDPLVVVRVAEYSSRPVSVVGAVRKPLTFQAVGRVTLLDAVARAEGLNADAGPELILSRTRQGEREVIRIPVIELMQKAKPELNYVLLGGEEIRVPEAQKVYVVGNVKKPGAYVVRDGTPMTVLKILALAEGIERYAQKNAYIYRAENSSGARKEIVIELSRLMDRRQPDELLEPEDVLYIPEAKGKKATLGALEKAASFGMATASGVLIWH